MSRCRRFILALFFAAFAFASFSVAWPRVAAAAPAPTIMVETDPSTFVLGGFAAHARVQADKKHTAFGVGAYALDFPKPIVEVDGRNRGDGWKVRLNLGVAAFVDYYVAPAPRGLFFGVQLAGQQFRYRNENSPGEQAFGVNALLMPRVGYLFRPFDAGFYLLGWAGLGATAPVAGSRGVGGREYKVFPLIPFAAVHVGWQF